MDHERRPFVDRELEPGQANDGTERSDDPEPHDDLALGPAEELKVMVQRGAAEKPLAPPFEIADLQQNADGLENEHATNDGPENLLPGDHRQQSEQAADR